MNNLSISLIPELYSQKIIKTKIFNINMDGNGIVKLDAPDWVNVAVYNKDIKKWILVKEHRNGIDNDVIEFMSGTVEKNEEPKKAAIRELGEELGYNLSNIVNIEELYSIYANPAFMNNKITGFYIEVEGLPGNTNFDEDEYVEAIEVSTPLFKNNGIISELTRTKVENRYERKI